jgi:hypothetical protein
MYALTFTVFQGTAKVIKKHMDMLDNVPRWTIQLNDKVLTEDFEAPAPDLNNYRQVRDFERKVADYIDGQDTLLNPDQLCSPSQTISVESANKPKDVTLIDCLTLGWVD